MNYSEPRISNSLSEIVNGFRRTLQVSPPYDKRHADPTKNYGIHGLEFRYFLGKNNRAIQFVVYTPIYLPAVADELFELGRSLKYNTFRCQGADVGYHSPMPQYDGQGCMDDNCTHTGGPCYYDGSGLRAEEWMVDWFAGGSDAIWPKMEQEWARVFGDDEDDKNVTNPASG